MWKKNWHWSGFTAYLSRKKKILFVSKILHRNFSHTSHWTRQQAIDQKKRLSQCKSIEGCLTAFNLPSSQTESINMFYKWDQIRSSTDTINRFRYVDYMCISSTTLIKSLQRIKTEKANHLLLLRNVSCSSDIRRHLKGTFVTY